MEGVMEKGREREEGREVAVLEKKVRVKKSVVTMHQD